MKKSELKQLLKIAKEQYDCHDIAHDFSHAYRVLKTAQYIASKEPDADMDIVITSALFHDIVSFKKNSPQSKYSTKLSAELAKVILLNLGFFNEKKIEKIVVVIHECSFSANKKLTSIESKIIKDADLLEGTGAIEVMRIFAYSSYMNRKFYNIEDPFPIHRDTDGIKYALDYFFKKTLRIPEHLNTQTALSLVAPRHEFIIQFIKELVIELGNISQIDQKKLTKLIKQYE
jgi:uncharacterized protein